MKLQPELTGGDFMPEEGKTQGIFPFSLSFCCFLSLPTGIAFGRGKATPCGGGGCPFLEPRPSFDYPRVDSAVARPEGLRKTLYLFPAAADLPGKVDGERERKEGDGAPFLGD